MNYTLQAPAERTAPYLDTTGIPGDVLRAIQMAMTADELVCTQCGRELDPLNDLFFVDIARDVRCADCWVASVSRMGS